MDDIRILDLDDQNAIYNMLHQFLRDQSFDCSSSSSMVCLSACSSLSSSDSCSDSDSVSVSCACSNRLSVAGDTIARDLLKCSTIVNIGQFWSVVTNSIYFVLWSLESGPSQCHVFSRFPPVHHCHPLLAPEGVQHARHSIQGQSGHERVVT